MRTNFFGCETKFSVDRVDWDSSAGMSMDGWASNNRPKSNRLKYGLRTENKAMMWKSCVLPSLPTRKTVSATLLSCSNSLNWDKTSSWVGSSGAEAITVDQWMWCGKFRVAIGMSTDADLENNADLFAEPRRPPSRPPLEYRWNSVETTQMTIKISYYRCFILKKFRLRRAFLSLNGKENILDADLLKKQACIATLHVCLHTHGKRVLLKISRLWTTDT